MILVDTSVWIDHLRRRNPTLAGLLEEEQVITHPFVIGELVCGTLRQRGEVLTLLRMLPAASVAAHDEVLQFVEDHRLYNRGIGWVDAHLLSSARLSNAGLWTLDKPLRNAAAALALAF